MQINKMVKTLSKKKQRLKNSGNYYSIKTFKQFLENFGYAID